MASNETMAAADLYFKNSSLMEQNGVKLLNMVQHEISPGSLVLDLGCGTGYLATVLSEMVGVDGKVVAVDPDAERIKIAKEKNPRPNIDYCVADDQSFPGDGYTLIAATHVIHWIKNKEALFSNVCSKLTDGGHFVFVTCNGTPVFPPIIKKALHDLICADFEENLLCQKMSYSNVDEYNTLAVRSGLAVCSTDIAASYIQWNCVEQFLHYWTGLSQGDVKIESLDRIALEYFKGHHEKELISEVLQLSSLFVVLYKSTPQQ